VTAFHTLRPFTALLIGLAAGAREAPRAAPADTPVAARTTRGVAVQPSAAAAEPAQAPADGRALPCPAREFAGFLAAFAERPRLQRQFTRFPLAYVTVEDGPDEPAAVERQVPSDSAPEPLFPSAAARARDGLAVGVDSALANRRVVRLFKPDTDAQIEYTFERQADGCWLLTRYDNQSL
jgi:hypothetical protein